MTSFPPPLTDASEQDETAEFRPKFDSNGLIPAIAQDAETGEVLMMAWMNAEALSATIETRKGTYYSRSRKKIWVKGETSGHVQIVTEILTDCDQDVILLKINQTGAACHTHRRSCFYRELSNGQLLKNGDVS